MCDHYRVRLRRGDIEVEVASSKQSYVDQKLSELLAELTDGVPSLQRDPKPHAKGTESSSAPRQSAGRTMRSEQELHGLVQYIQQHDDITAVDRSILSSSSQLARVLMCLFYGKQHFADPYLTTGEIEFVTNQLGVRIRRSNAGTALRNNPRCFTTDAVRKKGAIVGYKLSRAGGKHFAELLEGKGL